MRGIDVRPIAIRVISVGLLLLIWYLSAWIPARPIFPPPHVVAGYLIEDIQHPAIWHHLLVTLTRIFLGFSLAMAIAVPFGITRGFSRLARELFGSWVVIGLMTPSLVFIILCYTTIGLNELAAVIAAALSVLWVLTINIWESAKAIDMKLVQMGRAFKLSKANLIRRIVLPQLAAPLLASARFGLGLIWKMVLFVELIGRSNGIGYQIEHYYQQFDLFFVIIMLLIEVMLFGSIERRLFRWRPAARMA
jgi:NitT/TauT family transport system permease protein